MERRLSDRQVPGVPDQSALTGTPPSHHGTYKISFDLSGNDVIIQEIMPSYQMMMVRKLF